MALEMFCLKFIDRQEVSKEYNKISECKNDSVIKYFSKYDISFMSHLSKCIKSKYECLTEDEKATLNSNY